jgi:hypothetical protein
MVEMGAAARLRDTDRAGARSRLEAIWARIEHDHEPIHEVALSHWLANLQDDPVDELAWHLRAFGAAKRCTDADVQRHSPTASSVAEFMPSMHVNLGWAYSKLGDFAHAREHVALARSFAHLLPDDSYGQSVRSSIERLVAKGLAGQLSDQGMMRTALRAVGGLLIALVIALLGFGAWFAYLWGFNPFMLWPADLIGLLICGGLLWLILLRPPPRPDVSDLAKTFE